MRLSGGASVFLRAWVDPLRVAPAAAWCGCMVVVATLWGSAALAESADHRPPRLVVLDLELSGDLGGDEFTAEHEARLKTESARLRRDLQGTGLYELLDTTPAQAAIEHLKSQQAYLHDCNGCDLDIGRQLGAERVMVAWVNRVSGLILTLTYEIHDVKTAQIMARKSYDFRGDNDNTWNHAVDYMVRDLVRDAKACSTNC